jgi:hypothetical protein
VYGCAWSRSKTGSPSARSGAIASSTRSRSPVEQTTIATIRSPCQGSGTNGAAGARMQVIHTASSRGAPLASARYTRMISAARSNGHAMRPPKTVGPTRCRRYVNDVTTPRLAPAPCRSTTGVPPPPSSSAVSAPAIGAGERQLRLGRETRGELPTTVLPNRPLRRVSQDAWRDSTARPLPRLLYPAQLTFAGATGARTRTPWRPRARRRRAWRRCCSRGGPRSAR